MRSLNSPLENLNSVFYFSSLICLIAQSAACIPSYTPFAICKVPPVQSPDANSPCTLLCMSLSTIILLFSSNNTPNFFARSLLDAVPIAINKPSIFSFVPSSYSTSSNLLSPLNSRIRLSFI